MVDPNCLKGHIFHSEYLRDTLHFLVQALFEAKCSINLCCSTVGKNTTIIYEKLFYCWFLMNYFLIVLSKYQRSTDKQSLKPN